MGRCLQCIGGVEKLPRTGELVVKRISDSPCSTVE